MKTDPVTVTVAVAEALGLDPHMIRKGGLRITFDGYVGPIIEVEYLGHRLDGQKWDDVEAVLRRYKLVPLEDEQETA